MRRATSPCRRGNEISNRTRRLILPLPFSSLMICEELCRTPVDWLLLMTLCRERDGFTRQIRGITASNLAKRNDANPCHFWKPPRRFLKHDSSKRGSGFSSGKCRGRRLSRARRPAAFQSAPRQRTCATRSDGLSHSVGEILGGDHLKPGIRPRGSRGIEKWVGLARCQRRVICDKPVALFSASPPATLRWHL